MSQSGGYFSNESVERVRASTDIVSVIGRYVNLKRSGRSIKGLCPFHKEKTPSFFVTPERQMYHCFGCGAGGDVFSFLMNYLSFSFTEAVEELASEAGIKLERTGRDTTRTDIFREIIVRAQSFYRKQFRGKEATAARDYLEERKLSQKTIEKLGIGWAPHGNTLSAYLRREGYSESQLIESGIVLRSTRDSGVYDRFRDRILFPISDRRGRVISFGGRLIEESSTGAPKYLNGADSPIYRKGDYLYGYRDAAIASRELDMVILVEGYFDHARLVDAGFECVVATCGTAITPPQARQIGALASSIFVCYDGDSAGQRASVRASEIIMEQGYLPRIIAIPRGQDPDDYILERGGESVLELTGRANDPIRYALELLGGWSSVTDSGKKVRVVKRLVEIASSSTEPVIRETMLKVISEETGYSMKTLELEINEEDSKIRKPSERKLKETELNKRDSRILGFLLLSPEGLSNQLVDFIVEDDFQSKSGSRIFSEIKRQVDSGMKRFQFSHLEDNDSSVCAGLLTVYPEQTEPEDIERLMKAVKKDRLKSERKQLKLQMDSADNDDDIQELRRRIREIEEIEKKYYK
ncbi:MAG: DNA primase [Candidatus Aegiribacteria sp.]|nr:DNA primase [Candidatus Aegiribacteria sp.]